MRNLLQLVCSPPCRWSGRFQSAESDIIVVRHCLTKAVDNDAIVRDEISSKKMGQEALKSFRLYSEFVIVNET